MIVYQQEQIMDKIAEVFDKTDFGTTQTVRQAAMAYFQKHGIPTMKQEEWKYTSIRQAFQHGFLPVISSISPADISLPPIPDEATKLVWINGIFSPAHSNLPVHAGIDIHVNYSPSPGELSIRKDEDALVAFHHAFSPGGYKISAKGSQEQPIHIVQVFTDNTCIIQPYHYIEVAPSSSLTVVNWVLQEGQDSAFANTFTSIKVAENASCHYINIQDIGTEKYLVDTVQASVAQDARFHACTYSFSGEIIRNNLEITLKGERSEGHLHGLYLIDENTQVDNRTVVDHAVPNCYSNELYKGIIGGTATGVFNGKIIVRPYAQKTNAFQSNRNILTSDGANIYSKPQLEIFADDVKCSHGATSSRIDNKETFYLQTRGISKALAESLLIYAFAADTVASIPDDGVKSMLEEIIAKKLHINL